MSTAGYSRLDEWRHGLAEPLAHLRLIGATAHDGHLALLCPPKEVADDTLKLLVRDLRGVPRAVVLGSPVEYPDAVSQSMERARLARAALGARLGLVILNPLAEGRISGRSYALLPYCFPLCETRWIRRVQRILLGRPLFAWLRQATQTTRSGSCEDGARPGLNSALEHLAGLREATARVRTAAERGLDRLSSGAWVPQRVLLHGDFWTGNVLTRPQDSSAVRPCPSWHRLRIIDWGGSRLDGTPMFDLLRLAREIRASRRRLRSEVTAHCKILGCDLSDAGSYLALALGELGLRLENFPMNRYLTMADALFATLQGALESER